MRILVHSLLGIYARSQASFAFLIKTGYILSDQTVSLGYSNLNIFLLSGLKEGSKEYKFKMMRGSLDFTEFANEIHEIDNYFIDKDKFDKTKRKTPEQIKAFLINESRFVDYYKKWVIRKAVALESDGYDFLEKLMDGKIIERREVKEENLNFTNEINISLESLYNMNDTDCKNNMLIFHDMFLNVIYLQPEDKFVKATDAEAINTDNSYFHYVASISNVNSLSQNELMALRTDYHNKMASIKAPIDQWLEICNTDPDYTKGLTFFRESLIPLLPAVDVFFQETDVLKYNHKITREGEYFYLYIGQITKSTLLNYYQSFMPLTPELKQTLKDKFIADNTYERRIPVMIISHSKDLILPIDLSTEKYNYLVVNDEEQENTEIHKRKFISIED